MATETDVLVAGAGPVGMTLALSLRRAGVRVLIADKSPTTTQAPRAAIVWPRTLEVLDFLGVAEGWTREGVPLGAFEFEFGGRSTELSFAGLPEPFPKPLGIGQDRTEALLEVALKRSGADYRRGAAVVDVRLGDDGIEATVGGEPVRAGWIVGCEGSHSVVREAAGIARPGTRNDGIMLLQADALVSGSLARHPDRAYFWSGTDKANLLILPTRRDGHCRVLVGTHDDGQHGDPSLDEVQTASRRFVPGLVLSDPIWLNRFRTAHGVADRYRVGRAFIVGDAAHTWVPIGGQGMNIGMQDAHNLGWKLAAVVRGELPEAALDTYAEERRPIAESNVADTERLFHALMDAKTPMDHALRWVLPHLIGLGSVGERVAQRLSEVDFHYPQSSLVGEGGGVRAPDAYVARVATGETIRLFDLYRKGWTALAWAVEPEDENPARAAAQALGGLVVDATHDGLPGADLRDLTREASREFGIARGTLILVRPDGVVAFRGELSNVASARALRTG